MTGINLENLGNPYKDVVLTDEEANAALDAMRHLKGLRLEQEAKDERARGIQIEMRTPWTAKEFGKIIIERARVKKEQGIYNFDFVVDDYNREVLNILSYYFTNDPRLETVYGYSLKKGLALCGPNGTGKTTMMELCAFNKRNCFDIIPTRTIATLFAKNGDYIIDNFVLPRETPPDPNYFYQKKLALYADDAGKEDNDKGHYGNKMNVIREIILNRYDYKIPFDLFHFSTNLTAKGLFDAYGVEVSSRLKQTTNIIEVKGPDRRGNKS